jgi:hypothetical protein
MKGNASRQAFAAVLLGAAMLAPVLPADAASRICRQLQAELADASGGRGQPRLVAKYDSAIDRQRGEIEKARGQAPAASSPSSAATARNAPCWTRPSSA